MTSVDHFHISRHGKCSWVKSDRVTRWRTRCDELSRPLQPHGPPTVTDAPTQMLSSQLIALGRNNSWNSDTRDDPWWPATMTAEARYFDAQKRRPRHQKLRQDPTEVFRRLFSLLLFRKHKQKIWNAFQKDCYSIRRIYSVWISTVVESYLGELIVFNDCQNSDNNVWDFEFETEVNAFQRSILCV